MNKKEIALINELLRKKGREDLICDVLYERSFQEVKVILEMPEWKDKKFQELLTSNIWQSNATDIQTILQMPEWKDEKFQGLLTSNIWKRNPTEVKAILEMPEWNDERFKGLLTSTIWQSNATEVKNKLNLKYWNDTRYQHLLVPSIFATSIKNITDGIALLEKYGISEYITNNCLRKNQEEQESLIKYMLENKLDLIVEDKNGIDMKLSPLLSASNTNLKKKYHIDIKEIHKAYKDKVLEER